VSGKRIEWPYEIKYGQEKDVYADVVVLGGGLAGCYAAIGAARKGLKVALCDKSNVIHSGSGGTGIDHYSCPSNPACKLTIDEYMSTRGTYANYIAKYIMARDSYEVLCEMEKMGCKVRDTDDEFLGADFRDDETKLLFANDYEFRQMTRLWGGGMKPALVKECERLGVNIYNRVMATSLLSEDGKQGGRIIGATGLDTQTGEMYIFHAKAVVMAMCTPDRLWIFSSEWVGLMGRDGPPTNSGNGHAMAYRAGAELVRMESSTHEEWGGSTGIGSVLFGSGSTFSTWFPCNMVDADGKPIPWERWDGKILDDFAERTHPAPGQGYFTMALGGSETNGKGYLGASPGLIHDLQERIEKGEYKLPLYADLPSMSPQERRAIFGLMVGHEGQTYPVYRNLTRAGFDPEKDLLQAYDMGSAPVGWRRLRYGGLMHDWDLKTNLDGLYGAGGQLFDGCGCSIALTTGRWAGSIAADYTKTLPEEFTPLSRAQIDAEKERIYAPIHREDGINWKELEAGIGKVLQDYCGDNKNEELFNIGLQALDEIKNGEAKTLVARNPHELMRAVEAMDILTCAEMVINASKARKASSFWLFFDRIDYPDRDPAEWNKWLAIKEVDGKPAFAEYPLDYYGYGGTEYEKRADAVIRDAEIGGK